uniref:Mre11_DNA_bind domain-containing protein n=1 Tax=Syphacia muris TaxID=451379 RepID=A0A0N5AYB9_9BILA
MSATEQMAAMLNELMGPKRNADFGDDNEPDFDEPDVCKHFLVAFCPNEMFKNTKADLGFCPKIHDPALRTKYRQSSRFEKLGYEEDFLNKIRRLDDDVRRKIEKNERRLAVTQPVISAASTSSGGEGETEAHRRQKELIAEQQSSLSAKISECMEKAETLGAQGKVDEAKEAVRQAEKFKQERAALDRLLTQSTNPTNHIEDLANQLSKPMEVCQVCGCFMLVNDVQQRIDDHYAGKQHMAYAKIRSTIEEMEKKMEEKRKERAERDNREREKRDKDRKDREERDRNDRKRDDRERDRERDRDRRSRHRSRSPRSRRDSDRRYERFRGDRRDRDRRDDRSRHRVKVLVATDMHVGFGERFGNRENDSLNTLEEVLKLAKEKAVDFVLLGGDLFHENKPSRETQLQVTRLFRKYCLGNRPVSIQYLSDPAVNFKQSQFLFVNYEDSNINVEIPVFSIHGNHDDLTGKGLSALDVLHESGLINFFGKFENIDEFIVSPILLKKGKTHIALYGIGSQRDDRLCRAFREEKIRFLRPKNNTESWFSVLVLHQNRPRRSQDRSTGAHLPESLIPTFFDLVIWGHEHECKIEPQYYESSVDVCGDGFYIIQPGSTIATSLSAEEAVPKKVTILTIYERKFFSNPILLQTPRQILFADLLLTIDPPFGVTKTHRVENMLDEKIVMEKIDAMLREGKLQLLPKQPKLPLLRLRVTYPESWSNAMKLQCRRIGVKYANEVANPMDMVVVKVAKVRCQRKQAKAEKIVFETAGKAKTLEEIVNSQFINAEGVSQLAVLTPKTLNELIRSQVELDEGKKRKDKPLSENINAQKEKLVEALSKINYEVNTSKLKDLENLIMGDIIKARDLRIQKTECR